MLFYSISSTTFYIQSERERKRGHQDMRKEEKT